MIPVFVLVLLGIGMVSAVVVNYLSNQATATVEVKSPMEIAFAKIGPVDSNGGFAASETWTTDLTMLGTTGLSTSTVGVKVVNNADITIANKWLQLNVSNSLSNVDCGDISSLMFWDTATPIQIAKGYQELSSLCVDKGNYVIYNIDINSLGAGQTYYYPAKITFGVVTPTTYTFDAQMLDSVV